MSNKKMDLTPMMISVLLLAFIPCSMGNVQPLEVTFENTTQVDAVLDTTNVLFRCHFNRDPMFVIRSKINIVHVNPVTSKETVISSAADLAGSPKYYDVSLSLNPEDQEAMILSFTILKVRYQDDGTFICRAQPGPGISPRTVAHAERKVVVHRPMTSLNMKFGDLDDFGDTPKDPIEIEPGVYNVTCIAKGSNPGTEYVRMSLNGTVLSNSTALITSMEGTVRRYKTVSLGWVKVMANYSGQELVCEAKDSTGQTMYVRRVVNVTVRHPDVVCNDTKAFIGQRNVDLYCTVNSTGLDVRGLAFQVGDSGEIVREGDTTRSRNMKVTVSIVGPDVRVAALQLAEAGVQDVDRDYYILIGLAGDYTMRKSLRLSKIKAPDSGSGGTDDGKDSGPKDDAGLGVSKGSILYLLMCMSVFWLSH